MRALILHIIAINDMFRYGDNQPNLYKQANPDLPSIENLALAAKYTPICVDTAVTHLIKDVLNCTCTEWHKCTKCRGDTLYYIMNADALTNKSFTDYLENAQLYSCDSHKVLPRPKITKGMDGFTSIVHTATDPKFSAHNLLEKLLACDVKTTSTYSCRSIESILIAEVWISYIGAEALYNGFYLYGDAGEYFAEKYPDLLKKNIKNYLRAHSWYPAVKQYATSEQALNHALSYEDLDIIDWKNVTKGDFDYINTRADCDVANIMSHPPAIEAMIRCEKIDTIKKKVTGLCGINVVLFDIVIDSFICDGLENLCNRWYTYIGDNHCQYGFNMKIYHAYMHLINKMYARKVKGMIHPKILRLPDSSFRDIDTIYAVASNREELCDAINYIDHVNSAVMFDA